MRMDQGINHIAQENGMIIRKGRIFGSADTHFCIWDEADLWRYFTKLNLAIFLFIFYLLYH